LLLALGVITLGVRGYILQHLRDGVLSVWQVTWLTLPLVVATAILVYRWRARQPTSLAGFIGIVLATLFASYLTGLSSGQRVAESLFHVDAHCLLATTCDSQVPSNPLYLVARTLGVYWQIYGSTGFLSAVAIGAFLGYALALGLGTDRSLVRPPPSQPSPS
jgi:hypothetical protein